MKALFVSHLEERCGVGQFGRHIAKTLVDSDEEVEWQAIICNDPTPFMQVYQLFKPDVVVYNHHPATMPWYYKGIVEKPAVGIIHESTWVSDGSPMLQAFDYIIHPDPTFPEVSTPVPLFRTPRLLYEWDTQPSPYDIPTFGSFGFGFLNKVYVELIKMIEAEFDEAIIRLHIPFARYGDNNGEQALAQARMCRETVSKPGIQLEITHDYMRTNDLLQWLADNWMNCFMYTENRGRGLSSTTDYALSVDRPIAINNSYQFRHLTNTTPSIMMEDLSLREIMDNGVTPLLPLKEAYSAKNFIKCYNDMIKTILED